MIATIDYAQILNKTDSLTDMILQSDLMDNYKHAYLTLQNDREAQTLIQSFLTCKENYEEVQRFGRYHPDYRNIMKDIRRKKRAMDMHQSVAQFKVVERDLQRFLDNISESIANSVSDSIMVPTDGFASSGSGCSSSGCGSGGSCGCSA